MRTPRADVPDAPAHAPVEEGVVARLRSLWSFEGRARVLHLTWLAFFLTFVVWFNFAPFSTTIGDQLGLDDSQLLTLGLCNVALTVPARLFVGMALDRWGPRRTYSAILVYAAFPCLAFALAQDFGQLVVSRLALSVVGAGFVVGIRMVSEWFPPRELGTAEGVYGGWGNFGAAAAAFSLPLLASAFAAVAGGEDGWRWAIALTGLTSAAYGLWYRTAVTDTPEGVAYARPRRQGALEVTSRSAVTGLMALTVPVWAVLAVIAWRVWDAGVLPTGGLVVALVALAAVLASQLRTIRRVNEPALADDYPEDDRYPFRNVVVLCLAYFCTFGSELAVVTMLPTFFEDTWALGPVLAGIAASSAAFLNLVARPGGGLLSDVLGSRRRTLRALLVGLTLGYLAMATLGPGWPVLAAVALSLACSMFGQAGNGAVYAIVPLVKKRVSGQVAGMAGAYGNVGALVFLTVLLLWGHTVFFLVIAACSAATLALSRWLVEPRASFAAELLVDGADADTGVAERPVPVHAPTRLPAPVAVG
jgi:NNP family nitrate/nitrite transporter-like MFS transporter